MEAKLKMEEKSTGTDVEASELHALLEEEKELIIHGWEDDDFEWWQSENKQEFTRHRPWATD